MPKTFQQHSGHRIQDAQQQAEAADDQHMVAVIVFEDHFLDAADAKARQAPGQKIKAKHRRGRDVLQQPESKPAEQTGPGPVQQSHTINKKQGQVEKQIAPETSQRSRLQHQNSKCRGNP